MNKLIIGTIAILVIVAAGFSLTRHTDYDAMNIRNGNTAPYSNERAAQLGIDR